MVQFKRTLTENARNQVHNIKLVREQEKAVSDMNAEIFMKQSKIPDREYKFSGGPLSLILQEEKLRSFPLSVDDPPRTTSAPLSMAIASLQGTLKNSLGSQNILKTKLNERLQEDKDLQQQMQDLAAADETIAGQLEGKNVVKTIAVPGKLVNFVVK